MAYINLGQVIYPVGAIYASANSTSPASLFGGSWTQITDAALRGATSVGYTGSDTHILTIKEMPSHIHNMKYGSAPQASTGQYAFVDRDMNDSFSTQWREPSALQPTGGGQHIPVCNAPTIVICGNVQAKSQRGDVAWPTSTLDKLCTQLEHTSSPTTQQVLQVYLEELGQLLMRDDSFVPQAVDTMLARKAEQAPLLWFVVNYQLQFGSVAELLTDHIQQTSRLRSILVAYMVCTLVLELV